MCVVNAKYLPLQFLVILQHICSSLVYHNLAYIRIVLLKSPVLRMDMLKSSS